MYADNLNILVNQVCPVGEGVRLYFPHVSDMQ